MKIYLKAFLVLILLVSCKDSVQVKPIYTSSDWENPEWENPEVFQINRESPKATFYNYDNLDNAILGKDWKSSSNYKLLNGIWNFYYSDSIQGRPENFYKDDWDLFW